jgi:hypothetical protein
MWFKIGYKYQSSYVLNTWWLGQVLIILLKSLCKLQCRKEVSQKYQLAISIGVDGVSIFKGTKSNVTQYCSQWLGSTFHGGFNHWEQCEGIDNPQNVFPKVLYLA